MLVNEQFRKCVTFLYADVRDRTSGVEKRVPVGSTFFVGIDLFPDTAPGNCSACFAVTARHVAEYPARLWLRMRLRAGGYKDFPIDPSAWEPHPSTDVAVASMASVPLADCDYAYIPTGLFATADLGIGEGDDVFFSGLFIAHYGKGVPQPIIRFGNVSLMPREPVHVEISKRPQTFADIEAYLVEARSWGGQSGSPAFLSMPIDREMRSDTSVMLNPSGPPFALLGLVQGMWKNEAGFSVSDVSGESVVEINMGISVVVPAEKILEVVVESDACKAETARLAAGAGQPGSLVPPVAASNDPASEFGRFEKLTRKLVNTPKPKHDEDES